MEFEELLKDALDETGAELRVSRDELLQLVALRGAHLAAISHEPGFDLALRAERDQLAIRVGLNATMRARAADSRIVGIIQAVLLGIAGRSGGQAS